MASAPQQTGALRAGLETYSLETGLGALPEEAVAAAITVATRIHEDAVLHRVSRAAGLVAASLRSEPTGRYRGNAAAITWFADVHVVSLPPLADPRGYQPAPGDVVEVTLTGTVLSAGSSGIWTLADNATGRRYQFALTGRYGAPNLRVLDAYRPQRPAGGHLPPPESGP
jgi:hypothetical protein